MTSVLNRVRLRQSVLVDVPGVAGVALDPAAVPGPLDRDEIGAAPPAQPTVRRARRLPQIQTASTLPTFLGLGVAAIGFVVIAYGWGRVAALTNVGLQMPYLLSAGLTGVGLVAVGVGLVNGWTRHQDAAERSRQLVELTATITELRAALAKDRP